MQDFKRRNTRDLMGRYQIMVDFRVKSEIIGEVRKPRQERSAKSDGESPRCGSGILEPFRIPVQVCKY